MTDKNQKELENLKLGEKTTYQYHYDPHLLEKVSFQQTSPNAFFWSSFLCTEFTSLCPKTGQPDFAKIFINYIPQKHLLESKSLKMYLFSYRNHGGFHESCVQQILNDCFHTSNPLYMEVLGEFTPRGGIAIFPFAQKADPLYQDLLKKRALEFAPGKYSCSLTKLY